MTVGLSKTDVVRLTVLDAIAAGTSITSFRKLPLAGRLSELQIDRLLVNVVLTELQQAGLVVCFGACDDVGEHAQLQSGGEQTWVMTAAGAAELDRLRERAHGSSGSAERTLISPERTPSAVLGRTDEATRRRAAPRRRTDETATSG